jgi:hypothetical protein
MRVTVVTCDVCGEKMELKDQKASRTAWHRHVGGGCPTITVAVTGTSMGPQGQADICRQCALAELRRVLAANEEAPHD